MKMLIIGCGSIGRRHATNLQELGVDDLLMFDADQRRSEVLATSLGMRKVNSLEQAYDEHPAAALICSPTRSHLRLASEALRHDCHLFIEKPLSHSVEGMLQFLNEVERRRRILLVGYNFRFDPLVGEMKSWLREERIGHVTSARIHSGCYLPWRHPWEDYRCGYGARQELGGGVILDAVHELDLALYFFGRPETVYCLGGRMSSLEIDVEDTAEILLSYPSSTISVHVDYVQQPPERWCEMIGEGGQIKADLFTRELWYFDGGGREWHEHQKACPLDQIYKIEMRHFLDCLEGKCTPFVNGPTAVQSLQIAEAAKQSMRLSRRVHLNEFTETDTRSSRSISA